MASGRDTNWIDYVRLQHSATDSLDPNRRRFERGSLQRTGLGGELLCKCNNLKTFVPRGVES